MGSSIYTAGLPDVMNEFGVGQTAASLGMALYVLGYGVGPMLFSPLSE
jgi:DHA1 family multidrug resistance protein-like MFS transporter